MKYSECTANSFQIFLSLSLFICFCFSFSKPRKKHIILLCILDIFSTSDEFHLCVHSLTLYACLCLFFNFFSPLNFASSFLLSLLVFRSVEVSVSKRELFGLLNKKYSKLKLNKLVKYTSVMVTMDILCVGSFLPRNDTWIAHHFDYKRKPSKLHSPGACILLAVVLSTRINTCNDGCALYACTARVCLPNTHHNVQTISG